MKTTQLLLPFSLWKSLIFLFVLELLNGLAFITWMVSMVNDLNPATSYVERWAFSSNRSASF